MLHGAAFPAVFAATAPATQAESAADITAQAGKRAFGSGLFSIINERTNTAAKKAAIPAKAEKKTDTAGFFPDDLLFCRFAEGVL